MSKTFNRQQKNLGPLCCPDWCYKGPTLEPGLKLGLAGQCLVPTRPSWAQPKGAMWACLPVGPAPASALWIWWQSCAETAVTQSLDREHGYWHEHRTSPHWEDGACSSTGGWALLATDSWARVHTQPGRKNLAAFFFNHRVTQWEDIVKVSFSYVSLCEH